MQTPVGTTSRSLCTHSKDGAKKVRHGVRAVEQTMQHVIISSAEKDVHQVHNKQCLTSVFKTTKQLWLEADRAYQQGVFLQYDCHTNGKQMDVATPVLQEGKKKRAQQQSEDALRAWESNSPRRKIRVSESFMAQAKHWK